MLIKYSNNDWRHMNMRFTLRPVAFATSALLLTLSAVARSESQAPQASPTGDTGAQAQPAGPIQGEAQPKAEKKAPAAEPAASAPQEQPSQKVQDVQQIVIVGTKSAHAMSVHSAPLTVSAFNADQLDALHINSLADLTTQIPNVRLNNAGTTAYSNASIIRGMGDFSSIPSTTPAVGIFEDGVYLGTRPGSMPPGAFDLEGVEILRGPQGLLFGRNTTAGAILVRTKNPTKTFELEGSTAVESGLDFINQISVSGPLNDGKTLLGKLALYDGVDTGYFHNLIDDNHHYGKSKTEAVHGALSWQQSPDLVHLLKTEFLMLKGDGPAVQNHFVYSPNSLNFVNDGTGYTKINNKSATLESNWTTSATGKVTNIANVRHSLDNSGSDIPGTPTTVLDGFGTVDFTQYSDELRYAGDVGRLSIVTGLFGYWDKLKYVEERKVAPVPGRPLLLDQIGGGKQDSSTLAAFAQVDYRLLDTVTLTLGDRLSKEKKTAHVALIATTTDCDLSAATCSSYGFSDSKSWTSQTPKVGLSWKPQEETNLYGNWTKGNRSGGFDLRWVDPASPPNPYKPEDVDSYEIGLKQYLFDKKVSVNVAGFINHYTNLQRDLAFVGPEGPISTTINAANATIRGFELEGNWRVNPDWSVSANYGYLANKFDKIFFSMVAQNGVVTPADYLLKLPHAPKNSYGVSIHNSTAVSFGTLRTDVSYTYQDKSFADDNNINMLNAVNNLDLNFSYYPLDSKWTFTLYGKDLLNKTTFGINTTDQVGFQPPATNSPLGKSRILGLKISYQL